MATLASRIRFGTPHQLEVLGAMEGFIRKQIASHLERRKLWMPNELSPADAGAEDEALLTRVREAARGIPAAVLVALALNLLTEEGLPHFHRLIATHFGSENAWSEWNNIWTAEEDRHGCAIRDYVRDARLYSMTALEQMQYQYIEAGFDPEWEQDPYRLLAYTSLQEKATQIAHSNTGRQAGIYEPRLQRVLAHVSGDESRHYAFYRGAFAEILRHDPNQALQSLQKVTLGFAMPGHNVTGFTDLSEVIARADIFGPRQYAKIVEELLEFWELGAMSGLSAAGEEARDKLMKVPARLSRVADYADAKRGKKAFKFTFLPADRQELTL
jgi:acyl-[acyl-carrier-protein] desaturase